MVKEKSFNHRQKMSALGHVVALTAVIVLGYVSFLGLVYLMKGQIVKAAVIASSGKSLKSSPA